MSAGALSLGFSPCPNDTFLFYALVHGRLPGAPPVRAELADVETLNQRARAGALDLTKASYGAVPHLLGDYTILRSGGALGRGCGPLVVVRDAPEAPRTLEALRGRPIAIPGALTTAVLLLGLRDRGLGPFRALPFARIPEAVAEGEVAAGLIIHESRFTYGRLGLRALADLGAWWEQETGLPIPLGAILGRRALGRERLGAAEAAVRASVEWAMGHPDETAAYVREHAQELEPAVIEAHIALYVNRFSVDLGPEGAEAVRALLGRAAAAGLAPPAREPLFL